MFHGSSPFRIALGEGTSFQTVKCGEAGAAETRQVKYSGKYLLTGGGVGSLHRGQRADGNQSGRGSPDNALFSM